MENNRIKELRNRIATLEGQVVTEHKCHQDTLCRCTNALDDCESILGAVQSIHRYVDTTTADANKLRKSAMLTGGATAALAVGGGVVATRKTRKTAVDTIGLLATAVSTVWCARRCYQDVNALMTLTNDIISCVDEVFNDADSIRDELSDFVMDPSEYPTITRLSGVKYGTPCEKMTAALDVIALHDAELEGEDIVCKTLSAVDDILDNIELDVIEDEATPTTQDEDDLDAALDAAEELTAAQTEEIVTAPESVQKEINDATMSEEEYAKRDIDDE